MLLYWYFAKGLNPSSTADSNGSKRRGDMMLHFKALCMIESVETLCGFLTHAVVGIFFTITEHGRQPITT